MARIELQGVAHSYAGPDAPAESFALQSTDLDWNDGDTYALLGPSGCGKTTLLGTISGLLHPTHGNVRFDGQDVTHASTRERNIAQVFQFPVVYDTMSVFDNLAFPLRNRGVAKGVIDRRVREIAAVLDLSGELSSRARRLSAEAKQRISLGRGLVRDDVAAILLDEPLTVLDPQSKFELRRRLKAVHEELRPTLVYVTHDQNEALTIADRVVVMESGRVVQEGTPEELFDAPADTFVASFIGNPGMNLVPCELDGARARVGGVEIPLAGEPFAGREAPFLFGVRPEHLDLAEPNAAGAVAAEVREVEDLGRERIVTVSVGAEPLRVKLGDVPCPAPGSPCGLVVPPERIRLFAGGRAIA